MNLYWLQAIADLLIKGVDTPGSGGIIFSIVLGTAALIYITATRWILKGADDE